MPFRAHALAGIALVSLIACDAPSTGIQAEPLKGDALRDRISGHQFVLTSENGARNAVLTYRADGTGIRDLSPNGATEAFTWGVRGNEICAGVSQWDWQCGRAAISGDNMTIRFISRVSGQERLLAGKLRPA